MQEIFIQHSFTEVEGGNNDASEVVESSLDFPPGSSLCSVCNKPVVTATLVPSSTQVTGVECQDCNSFFHLGCHKVCICEVKKGFLATYQ